MNDGGVGEEGVVAEGLVMTPEEEGESKMWIVFYLENNLGSFDGGEAFREQRLEMAPSGLRTLVSEN